MKASELPIYMSDLKEQKVLDHGFIMFIESMGTDEDVVEAARVSTGRGFISWDPYERCKQPGCGMVMHSIQGMIVEGDDCCGHGQVEKFPRGDQGILDYMMENYHTTPFEMCEFKGRVRVPMDHWRQWIRHRTASVNEYSTRYSEAIDEVAETDPAAWRTQGTTNRQGSGLYLPRHIETDPVNGLAVMDGEYLSKRERELHELSREIYQERLTAGVAKEQARKDLPLSTYTEAYWKIDLHNLLNTFLVRRYHSHAQAEIRAYATAIVNIVKRVWPHCWLAFEEYNLNSVKFSATEIKELRRVLAELSGGGVPGIDVRNALVLNIKGKRKETFLGKLGLVA